jgi:starch phosphorylase
MTALALRGSRFHNGVSRIHGDVASQMEGYIWPQIPHDENPISYVTNGVHVPTFLSREWVNLFDMRFGGEWRSELRNEDYWERIDEIPDHSYWSLRQSLKSFLLAEVHRRVELQLRRNLSSEAQINSLTRHLNPDETDTLILGFARRFATYKRATLLFSDPERLARILNNPERPVILIFAGKAHPNDQPGQHLIQVIHDFSRRPEFEGRIILLEGYDLSLGRKLVTGVDVWVNTPEYPLEASGTSGQKAGINGVINLSVLDGWWGEGYTEDNGWAITPHGPQYDAAYRNREEANALLDILEYQVVTEYYDRHGHGYPANWVKRSKASMKTTLPRFNSQRMVMDYVRDFYSHANRQNKALSADNFAPAQELATWKRKIRMSWQKVKMRRIDEARQEIKAGATLPIRVAADLDGLESTDVIMECLVGEENARQEFVTHSCHQLEAAGKDGKETIFQMDLQPSLPGLQFYRIRLYPYHKLLGHPYETGCMIWL